MMILNNKNRKELLNNKVINICNKFYIKNLKQRNNQKKEKINYKNYCKKILKKKKINKQIKINYKINNKFNKKIINQQIYKVDQLINPIFNQWQFKIRNQVNFINNFILKIIIIKNFSNYI